jgi:hypothetical protein
MKRRLLDPDWQPWWKTLLKFLLGLNLAAVIKSVLRGWTAFRDGAVRSFDACDPLSKVEPAVRAALLQIPAVKLSHLLGDGHASIQLDVQRYEDGMLPNDQAVALLSLAVLDDPATVLEIGTFCGHTTKLLAQNLPRAIVHTVDLPPDFQAENDPVGTLPKDDFHLIASRCVGREFHGQPEAQRIVQHFGDTAAWDFAAAKGATFFFIDGSHTYEYVKSDSEKCWALCGGHGTFLWHDCGTDHPGVVRLLTEWRRDREREVVRIEGTTLAYLKTC